MLSNPRPKPGTESPQPCVLHPRGPPCLGLRVQGLGLGFRVWGVLTCGVYGLGLRVLTPKTFAKRTVVFIGIFGGFMLVLGRVRSLTPDPEP